MDSATHSEPDRLVETTSEIFVGQWHRLVSTTNWEKGSIIYEWRQALIESGAPVQAFSDETWAQRVGGVSSQHVGRLRRVHERFAAVREQYASLYWSHFQAALDWNDAELWLEGARLEQWSVAEMRSRRWEAHGAPAELKPREEDVIATELSEEEPFAVSDGPYDEAPFADAPAAAAHDEPADVADDSEEATGWSGAEDSEPVPVATAPLTGFSSLPDDLLDAFEACKLAIVRHRLAGWTEVASATVVAALTALVDLAQAPIEA